MLEKITPAQLVWGDDNLPRSAEFGDLYFSAEDGLEEAKHVFLDGNSLARRWANLKNGDLFIIGETGFGSGLNLLAAAQLWQQVAPVNARLQFVSVEQYPMRREDLSRTHKHWDGLQLLVTQLIERYPPLTPGFHRFDLLNNIEVTLVFDEIESGLKSICPPLEPKLWDQKTYAVDAWFLDGFAPAKNPKMWQENLFPLLHRLSQEGTSIATFTAAGDVRRALQQWGFNVSKTPGYGRKREMLSALYNSDHKPDLKSLESPHKKPTVCWSLAEPAPALTDSPIAIIGAGIAGSTLASALAKRGKEVHVYDAGSGPAPGASGIEQVALYARLSPDAGDLEDFMLSAMPFSQRYYRELLANDPEQKLGSICGLIQIPRNDRELEKMKQVAERLCECEELVQLLNREELSSKAGISINSAGLYFPQSGWLNGKEICSTLLRQKNISCHYQTRIEQIDRNNGSCLLEFSNGESASYSQVVICNAKSASNYETLRWLPTKAIRGQVSFVPSNEPLQNIKSVICRETQLTPAVKNFLCTGSTYGLEEDKTNIREQDHRQNLDKLQRMIGQEIDAELDNIRGQAAVRCSTPDYLPIVGPVPNFEGFLARFSLLGKDAKTQIPLAGPVEPGLFVNLGYGSRGFTYAPLCAETLANQLCEEVPALPSYLTRAIHPSRFLVRGLTRGEIKPDLDS